MSATVAQKIREPHSVATPPADAAASEAAFPVIFVVTQSGNRANGGVESITQVLENLRRVRPIVVTHLETAATQRWRDAGCDVHAWDFSAAGVRTGSALQTNRRMFDLVRASGARVVHCNDISALWHTAIGARLAGATVILNVRNIKPAAQRYGWRWQLARKISRRQLVLSREMQNEFSRRLGVANGHRGEIEYIYSSVDSAFFNPIENSARAGLRARLGIDDDCFAIGCVAPFEPRKAQLEFIKETGPLLKQLVPRAKIYFIGDFAPETNDYARRCREAADALNLNGSISFVGFTSQVNEWYRALDLVVVASRNEGLARCMIESLACGTPVVSFDVCSAQEILEEHQCGVVVPQGDYQKLTQAIAALAERKSWRRQLSDSGVTLARQLFDPRQVVAQYEALYISLHEN